MISESYDLSEFFENVNLNDTRELIRTAEQEATAAERNLVHPHRNLGTSEGACREYVEGLKLLIAHLRCQLRPSVPGKWLALFQQAEMKSPGLFQDPHHLRPQPPPRVR